MLRRRVSRMARSWGAVSGAVLVVIVLLLSVTPVVTPTQAVDPIKVGGSLPLTGPFGETGKGIKSGMELWKEDVNRKGGLLGRPLELAIYDDASSLEKAVTFFERAITVDKVNLLIGAYPTPTVRAIMPLAEKYRKVFVSFGGSLEAFEQGFKYSFASPAVINEYLAQFLGNSVSLISGQGRPQTVAIISNNTATGIEFRKGYMASIANAGLRVVLDETYSLPLIDATPLVLKAKASGADVFVINGFFDDSVLTMRGAKAQKYNPKMILVSVGAMTPRWVSELGTEGDYVLGATLWRKDLPYPGNDVIVKGATAMGVAPTVYLFIGYAGMRTLELAVKGAGSLDQDKIREYLATQTFDLPYGRGIRFDHRGLAPTTVISAQILNGQVAVVHPLEMATTKLVYPRPPIW